MIADKKLRTVSLDTMIDNRIGKLGTSKRDAFEQELILELPGHAIKEARLYNNLPKQDS